NQRQVVINRRGISSKIQGTPKVGNSLAIALLSIKEHSSIEYGRSHARLDRQGTTVVGERLIRMAQRRMSQSTMVETLRSRRGQGDTDVKTDQRVFESLQAVRTQPSVEIRPKSVRLQVDRPLQFQVGFLDLMSAKQ